MDVRVESTVKPGTELLEYLASLSMSALPATATAQARLALVDNVACAVFGARHPWGRITAEYARDTYAAGNATLLGRTTSVAPAGAALANGTAMHGFELDDIILGSLVHPGAVAVSSALALAEERNASDERLLAGIVAGYEMMARLGAALGAASNTAGFHTTGVAGAVASAVAAAAVAGASYETMARAVGIACSSASGIKAFTQGTGGMVKRLHAGHAAEAGVAAFLLAERGFTGPLEGIDGRFGLLEVIGGPTAEPSLLSGNLGDNLAISRIWVKVWPCCGLLHTTVQAIEEFRDRDGVAASDIREIRVGVSERAVQQNSDPNPTDAMTAQYSIPYSASVAALKDARDPKSFADDALDAPDVNALIPKVKVFTDPDIEAVYPGKFATRVALDTVAGKTLETTIWDPHGSASDPCSEAELKDKFRRLCDGSLSASTQAAVLAAIDRLGDGGDVATLSAALRQG